MEDSTHVIEQYCIVKVLPQYFSSKIKITVDFGDELAGNYDVQTDIETLLGMASLIDALNYMAKKGWQLASSYTYNDPTKGALQHYMMKKRLR
jgi:hypothetical protein